MDMTFALHNPVLSAAVVAVAVFAAAFGALTLLNRSSAPPAAPPAVADGAAPARSTDGRAVGWYGQTLADFGRQFAGSAHLAGGTGSFLMAWNIASGYLPLKGTPPVNISYKTTPSAQTSLRASASSPRACSGDI